MSRAWAMSPMVAFLPRRMRISSAVDRIVARFEKLARERGEAVVFPF